MKKKGYVETRLKKKLSDPEFEKAWYESEEAYKKEREEIIMKSLENKNK